MKKTALITGAAKRLGREMSVFLAQNGWSIAIHYNRSSAEALVLKSELDVKYKDQMFELFQADLSQEKEVEKLLSEVVLQMGQVNLLINSASMFDSGFLKETNNELFYSQFSVNLIAPFILIREFARNIKKGIIINFVDTRITNNRSDFAAYSLSKKSLWELTKLAALEFAPNIRVNAIAPGVTLAPEDKDETYLEKLAEQIPMKTPSGVEPILQSLNYILTNKHLTGQLLFADGGENLGQNP